MKALDEHRHIEDLHLPRITLREIEPGPERVVQHEFDIGLLGDNLVHPALIFVIVDDSLIELSGLRVCNTVEVDTVKILKRRQLVSIETRGPHVLEIKFATRPPGIEIV